MFPSLPPTPKTQERSAEMSLHHCTLRKLYRMLKTAAAARAKPPCSTMSPLLPAIRCDHIINTQPFGWWDGVSGAEGCKRKLSRRHKLLLTALNGLTCTWCQNQALTEDAAISYQGSRNYGLGKGKGEHYSSS